MKKRHLSTLALAALLAYVLSAGCTQDFNVFQACGADQKVCGDACVPLDAPEHGCAAEGCDPCNLGNATSVCGSTGCEIGSCDGTFENCDGDMANGCEVDPMNDPANCGACDNACVTPNATPACAGGDCAIDICAPDHADCNGQVNDGCEANLASDPDTCGACDNPCEAFETCQAGQCVLDCPDGTAECDDDPTVLCETQLGTAVNCGFCGDTCDLANATGTCSAGACVVETCDAGFDDCNGMDADGCEANILDSAMTCGACNSPCPNGPNGTTVCDNGQCTLNCNSGFGDCDGNVVNGCETDLNGSLAHCGACGEPCSPQNGTGMCTAGSCQVVTCTAPFDDCDGNPANGCETNTLTSVGNCGTCGMACSFPNAVAACNNGTCAVGACNAGFDDCDGNMANGCETPTSDNPVNCGGCGDVCPGAPNAAPACVNSVCGLACNAGFENCDGAAGNGCEVNIATSVTNCGGCGRACSASNVASRSCTGGLCDSTCDLGSANCIQPAFPAVDDGCEDSVTNDNNDCGGCGNDCGQQGNPNNPFTCAYNAPGVQNLCGCGNNFSCNDGAAGNCNFGVCSCGGVACRPGEACANVGGTSTCTCNGGAACGAGETCCDTPAGCFDLTADPQNCGGCGRACPGGFVCFDLGALTAPECRCDEPADCNAGTPGTFSCGATGRCVCNGMTCQAGERCLPSGQCG